MTIESPPSGFTLSAGRSRFLDLSRGLASQLVLVGHSLNVALPATFMVADADGKLTARPGLPFMQNFGVLIFFFISGFLVTSSVTRKAANPDYGLAAFMADRFARIFTPLLPLLLIVFAGDHLVFQGGEAGPYTDANSSIRDLILNAFMLAGNPALSYLARHAGLTFLSSSAFGTADQLWTVIIEWWIYVLFGIMFFVVAARTRLQPLRSLVMLGLLGLALPPIAGALIGTPGLIVAWLIGMAGSFRTRSIDALGRRWLIPLAAVSISLAVALLALTRWNFYSVESTALLGIGFFCVLFSIDGFRLVASSRALRGIVEYMSNVSYSVYLVQLSVIFWIARLAPHLIGLWTTVLLFFVASNLAGWLFYLAFERHYRTVRRKLDPLVNAASNAARRNRVVTG